MTSAPLQETLFFLCGPPPMAAELRSRLASRCWMIIHDRVYDVTVYAPRHPSPPALFLNYCGREATVDFETKDDGRTHSDAARAQLEALQIGFLAPEPDGSLRPECGHESRLSASGGISAPRGDARRNVP